MDQGTHSLRKRGTKCNVYVPWTLRATTSGIYSVTPEFSCFYIWPFYWESIRDSWHPFRGGLKKPGVWETRPSSFNTVYVNIFFMGVHSAVANTKVGWAIESTNPKNLSPLRGLSVGDNPIPNLDHELVDRTSNLPRVWALRREGTGTSKFTWTTWRI